MKILRIVYEWPPPWHGLAPAPYEMTSAQVKMGHEVDVFCGRWPFSGPIEKLSGVKTHTFIRELLPGTLNITISPLVLFYYLFWKGRKKVDVIHSHGHFAIWIYAYRVFLKKFFPKAKELQIPLVVHFHNTVKGRWEKLKGQKKPIKWVSKKISWPIAQKSDMWAVSVADACIFVSGDTRQEAIKYYGADPARCFVVESGVNVKLFTPVGPEELVKTREEMGLKPGDKVILNCGAMVERKNIHLLIESLNFLPREYKLLLVGPEAPPEYKDKLKDAIVKYGLGDRIVRVGYTSYPQIPIAFQAADVFVLPSEWEGLPKAVMESLACGVPVLASGFKAQNDISGLIYLTDLDPEIIARKIQEVLEDGVTVDLGFVRSHYSWNVLAKKVEQIYAKVLSR
jgi:glycosyltransferase involved in cell wall biosynthesis